MRGSKAQFSLRRKAAMHRATTTRGLLSKTNPFEKPWKKSAVMSITSARANNVVFKRPVAFRRFMPAIPTGVAFDIHRQIEKRRAQKAMMPEKMSPDIPITHVVQVSVVAAPGTLAPPPPDNLVKDAAR
jgi:hypothetical protein